MREGPGDQIGVDLLDDRVLAVLGLGLHQRVGAVGGVDGSAICASEIHRCSSWSPTACGYRMSIHCSLPMPSHAARIFASMRVVGENRTLRRRHTAMTVLA